MTSLFDIFNPSKKNYFGHAARHPSAVNVSSSFPTDLSPLEVRKAVIVQRHIKKNFDVSKVLLI
jgi:hypothetical protein